MYRGCVLAVRGGGRGFTSHNPRCLRIFFYDLGVLDERNHAHRPLTLGAGEGVNLVDFLDEPCPVLAVPLGWFIGLQDARDQSVLVCLLALTPTDVAVVALPL